MTVLYYFEQAFFALYLELEGYIFENGQNRDTNPLKSTWIQRTQIQISTKIKCIVTF